VLPQVSADAAHESLTIEPAPSTWAGLVSGRSSRPLVIVTGHQAEFWHPGILAKYFAADAAARSLTAAGRPATVAWTVADQDSNDPSAIAYPMRTSAGPVRAAWQVPLDGHTTASSGLGADTPTAAMPPLAPPDDMTAVLRDLDPALPNVTDGLARIAASLRAHHDTGNAARQLTGALLDLLRPYSISARPIFASEHFRSEAFSELLERMRSDPAACVRAYNAAALRHPHAHVRPLVLEPGRVELPLWHMPGSMGSSRRPVFASDLADADVAHLAPRALLLTAIVRLCVCDLLIHGTGGGLYDQVTEDWLSAWLPGRELAPTAVVTATRLLPFDDRPLSPEAITRAQWQAHHALHNPADLGDLPAAAQKRELLQALRTARSRGQSPSVAFGQMHALLDQTRAARRAKVSALESAAAAALRQRATARVVYDRTWPFPLYPESSIEGLKSSIERAFGLVR
jgi:hypothetical protein